MSMLQALHPPLPALTRYLSPHIPKTHPTSFSFYSGKGWMWDIITIGENEIKRLGAPNMNTYVPAKIVDQLDMQTIINGQINREEYKRITNVLHQLEQISRTTNHSEIQPTVLNILDKLTIPAPIKAHKQTQADLYAPKKKLVVAQQVVAKLRSQDPNLINGNVLCTARGTRKSSVASVSLTRVARPELQRGMSPVSEEEKRFTTHASFKVNGRNVGDYFPRVTQWEQLIKPLRVVGQTSEWKVKARVNGGGLTGQADAITLALTKALIITDAKHYVPLEEAALIYKDSRVVERNKPGQPGARKKFTWVKR